MKRHFLWKGVAVAMPLIFLMFVFHVAAQPRGGARPGGGGIKPGGASKANFGGGSVVHRNFTPPANTPRPNIKPSVPSGTRPSVQPGKRPNLPDVPKRPTPRPDQGGRDLIPGDRPGGGIKVPDRKPIDRPDVRHADGPDWKNWSNIDKSKIHDSVVNRPPVNRDTVDRVRNHFDDHFADKKFFSKDWFDKHPDGWRPPGPGPRPPHPPGPGPHPPRPLPPPPPPHFWWHHPSWDHTWAWFAAGFVTGVVADAIVEPIVYDYGSNIVYHDETVYVNNVPYVDADTYYQQAVDLAEAGTEEKTSEETTTETAEQAEGTAGEWLSMGTFAVVADGKEKASDRIVQLATNKDGRIRGNLVDSKDDKAVELYGSVDPKTQRVAFKIAGNDDCVAECGLWNLTQDTVPLLVHVDKDRTEERTLVRLKDKE